MRIAILGATSQIAKDLIASLSTEGRHELVLFARRPDAVNRWLETSGYAGRYRVAGFDAFRTVERLDAIINFVGVGDPARAMAMGASILDVTLRHDELALDYLHQNPSCRYLFLSSGAAFGAVFNQPVGPNTPSVIAINRLQPHDWYSVAKLHAECRHRSLAHLPIVDIRVFNYFSPSQDIQAAFLVSDVLRAIQSGEVLMTSPDNIVRDYLGAEDFFQLVCQLLAMPEANDGVDCYTQAPVEKMALLTAMKERFGLAYEVCKTTPGTIPSGAKMNYFSTNHRAKDFGYAPSKTSMEVVLEASAAILSGE